MEIKGLTGERLMRALNPEPLLSCPHHLAKCYGRITLEKRPPHPHPLVWVPFQALSNQNLFGGGRGGSEGPPFIGNGKEGKVGVLRVPAHPCRGQ